MLQTKCVYIYLFISALIYELGSLKSTIFFLKYSRAALKKKNKYSKILE